MDTSASEYWPEEEEEMVGAFGETGSNYMCREDYLAAKRESGGRGPTAVTCMGANPGLVTFFLKRALATMWSEVSQVDVKSAGGWAHVARELGVRVIHIAERDTSIPLKPRKPGVEFFNTWSVDGFILEGVNQCADVGWGTHERELPENGYHYSSGCGAAIRIQQPSASVKCLSYVPSFGEQSVCCVTHYETTSTAHFLSVYDKDGKVVYRPTSHYAYHPCETALDAIAEIEANKWNPKVHTVRRVYSADDLEPWGVDELGVLIMTNKPNGTVWYGSTVNVAEAKQTCPYHTQATLSQISAGVIAGCLWIVRHPDRGIIEPEDMEEYEEVLQDAQPFLGKVHWHRCGWTPRGGDPTDDATWQFTNFQIKPYVKPSLQMVSDLISKIEAA